MKKLVLFLICIFTFFIGICQGDVFVHIAALRPLHTSFLKYKNGNYNNFLSSRGTGGFSLGFTYRNKRVNFLGNYTQVKWHRQMLYKFNPDSIHFSYGYLKFNQLNLGMQYALNNKNLLNNYLFFEYCLLSHQSNRSQNYYLLHNMDIIKGEIQYKMQVNLKVGVETQIGNIKNRAHFFIKNYYEWINMKRIKYTSSKYIVPWNVNGGHLSIAFGFAYKITKK